MSDSGANMHDLMIRYEAILNGYPIDVAPNDPIVFSYILAMAQDAATIGADSALCLAWSFTFKYDLPLEVGGFIMQCLCAIEFYKVQVSAFSAISLKRSLDGGHKENNVQSAVEPLQSVYLSGWQDAHTAFYKTMRSLLTSSPDFLVDMARWYSDDSNESSPET